MPLSNAQTHWLILRRACTCDHEVTKQIATYLQNLSSAFDGRPYMIYTQKLQWCCFAAHPLQETAVALASACCWWLPVPRVERIAPSSMTKKAEQKTWNLSGIRERGWIQMMG